MLIISPVFNKLEEVNYRNSNIMHIVKRSQNARLDESQGRMKVARRNINNFRYADDTTLMVKSEEELKAS